MLQELCQRLQSFFTDAEAQQGDSPQVDCFTISYKVDAVSHTGPLRTLCLLSSVPAQQNGCRCMSFTDSRVPGVGIRTVYLKLLCHKIHSPDIIETTKKGWSASTLRNCCIAPMLS